MNIVVIGGGAAGFFAAVNCAEVYPKHSVTILEKSNKLLAKVRVSGGGRCNVTNANFDEKRLAEYYPRGSRELRNAFSRFSARDTIEWFKRHDVGLKAESDGRMFPVTDNSSTIIECLTRAAEINNVRIKMNSQVKEIRRTTDGKFQLFFDNDHFHECDKVIITTGGNPTPSGYEWLEKSGYQIIPPVPSLFTFNVPDSPLKDLEGVSLPATVKLQGMNYESSGPLLITHWGISGPAVLRLSAFAARYLHENSYRTACIVKWNMLEENVVRNAINDQRRVNGRRKVNAYSMLEIPQRLWQRICLLSGTGELNYSDLSKPVINNLVRNITAMQLEINGKTTFKEEFVTCGGINLKQIDMKSMESHLVKGTFFAGEVLDVDGITGGYNFQAAWTTGYLAGLNAGKPGQ